VAAAFDRLTTTNGPVATTLAAHDIERFEREARRIDVAMASRAGFLRAVFGQLLANGRCATSIRLKRGHARWRRRMRFADQTSHDPDAALYGRGRGPIRGHFENARLREQPAPARTGR